jgi:hypothetical protein
VAPSEPSISADGKVNVKSLEAAQKYFMAKGTQTKALDMSKIVDQSFAQEAVKRLVAYQ